MNELIVRKKETTLIELKISELEKRYRINTHREVVPHTGNAHITFKNAQWIASGDDVRVLSKQELADDIMKLLGYKGKARLVLNFSYYWKDADDGIEGHETLRTYISVANLYIEK